VHPAQTEGQQMVSAVIATAPRVLRLAIPGCAMLLAYLATTALGCEECGQEVCEADAASWDFFTNYGNYMPRTHCLKTAEGGSDWPWIIALIGLTLGIIAAYSRIFIFWTQCYLSEKREDRNGKLMELACIFLWCAICGYALHVLIFFWPVYRLLAICLLVLNVWSWKFAWNLSPFRISFRANRIAREFNESLTESNAKLAANNRQLQKQHEQLQRRNQELAVTRQQLEQTVEELTVSNHDLDRFVYVASHDLKSPLRGINALAMFIATEIGDTASDQVRGDLNLLTDRVNRMGSLLDDLLEYSRAGRRNYASQTFDVLEEVTNAAAIINKPRGFEIEVTGEPVEITGALPPFSGVVRNLIDNALKHHDRDTGRVSVAISVLEENGLAEIRVSDDGPGIEPRFQARVFDMFQTLKPRDKVEGSGMGLAIVKRNIEANGGSISLQSDGRGASFRFTWPLHDGGGIEHEQALQEADER